MFVGAAVILGRKQRNSEKKPVAQVVIENPILNSPFEEAQRHWRFGDEGITDDVVEGRRIDEFLKVYEVNT